MSFVTDQIRLIDGQLDRLQLSYSDSPSISRVTTSEAQEQKPVQQRPVPKTVSKRVLALQAACKALSASSSDSRVLLKPWQVQLALSTISEQSSVSTALKDTEDNTRDGYEHELEWLLVAKATTQTYGHVVNSILDETVSLADDVWYWDEVLSSRTYTALYGIQISPLKFWHWSNTVWAEAQTRARNFNVQQAGQDASASLTHSWKEFYGLVRQVVRERSVDEINKQVVSPVTRLRTEVRHRQHALKKVRLRYANAVGVLLGEGLANASIHGDGFASPDGHIGQHKWKVDVARNVALLEAVLAKVGESEVTVDNFDDHITELTSEDPLYEATVVEAAADGQTVTVQPQAVAERLNRVLALAIPQGAASTQLLVRKYGRPPRIVRYWLPVTLGILSSSTILRILVNRRAEIVQWIEDFGATIVDFWRNWVVEPTRKVIMTIRHDESSEVSIMSKRSLEGDRDSLERMVVDFAVDNPVNATGSSAKLTDAEIADLRLKVREGDLTPVLKAYEKDLASPFMGTVRGNLIRALLIQIQKTKVDVEVAMGGIDALLKSQELVFGFVGLTPGILVTYFAASYLRSSFSSKRGLRAAQKQGKMVRQLRNIDRILTNSTPTDFGELTYSEQGLLLCEAHVLRKTVAKTMPSQVFREFAEDLDELCDVRSGIERQLRIVERIRWAYARWF